LKIERVTWLLLATLSLIYVAAVFSNLSLYSLDGAQQTYFHLKAIVEGRAAGHDFAPYLGPLLITTLVPVFLLLGGTLFASSAAAAIVTWVGFLISIWVVAIVFDVPARRRFVFSMTLIAVACAFIEMHSALDLVADTAVLGPIPVGKISAFLQRWCFPSTFDLISPGNSLRALRWQLPYLSVFLVWSASRLVVHSWTGRASLVGAVAGAHPYWSPDVGFPSLLAFVLVLAAYLALGLRTPFRSFASRLRDAGVVVGAGAVSFVLIGYALCGLHVLAYFRVTIGSIAADQFWFFFPFEENSRVFFWSDLLSMLMEGGVLGPLALILVGLVTAWRFVAGRDIALLAAIYVIGTTIGGALAPQVGGHVFAEYNVATNIPVLGFAICVFLPADDRRWPSLMPRAVFAAVAMAALTLGARARLEIASDKTMWLPEVGAFVSSSVRPEVEQLRRLRTLMDSRGVDRNRRYIGFYHSLVNIVLNTHSPVPYDALFQTLGEDNKAHMLRILAQAPPIYFGTIRPDYSLWANWNARSSWWIMRFVLDNYEPMAKTHQEVMWRRAAMQPPSHRATCSVHRGAQANVAEVEIRDEAGASADEVYWVELRIDALIEAEPTGLPVYGARTLLTVSEAQSGLESAAKIVPDNAVGGDPRLYGIGRQSGAYRIGLEHALGHTTKLTISSLPHATTNLVVDRCIATFVARSIRPARLPDLSALSEETLRSSVEEGAGAGPASVAP
jgi:hypothetical protein